MKKFAKVANSSPTHPQITKYIKHEDDAALTRTIKKKHKAIWVDPTSTFKGFKLQSNKVNQLNIERGNYDQNILDAILDSIKWICARHTRALVIRFDYFPAKAGIGISDFCKLIRERLLRLGFIGGEVKSSRDIREDDRIFKTLQYLWVRERGTHLDNGGVHYHCYVVCRKIDGLSPADIKNEFIKCAFKTLKANIDNRLNSKYLVRNDIYRYYIDEIDRVLQTLETDSFKDKYTKEETEYPYVSVRNVFFLERSSLHQSNAQKQQDEMNHRIRINRGYAYLWLSAIKEREHNAGTAIGGILEECIYALSYLAKIETKNDLDPNNNCFGKSQFRDVIAATKRERRTREITNGIRDINKIFDSYINN